MGTDIHAHVEVKFRGQWVHYNAPHVQRDYSLFAKLAGVRRYVGDGIVPVSDQRGLPDDISDFTRATYDKDRGYFNAHGVGYITREEMRVVAEWYSDLPNTQGANHGLEGVFGYLLGNPIYSLGDGLIEDCRIVFWFDN